LARWGFVANAIVYFIVGVLALKWGIGEGGRLTDSDGVFRELQRQSFGTPLLIALIPGFFSYAAWRLLAAIYDGDRDGSGAAGLFCRAVGLLKAALYAALGVSAWRLVSGGASTGSSSWSDGLLRSSAGRPLMFVVAAALIAFAGFEIARALQSRLSKGLRLYDTSAETRRWIVRVSRFGIGARALVIGSFAILLFERASSGRTAVPRAQQSFVALGHVHPALFVVAAAGLVAYGVYLVVLARYRRVETGA
jgi:hypothetical protein